MERVIVLNDVAYASDGAAGTVDKLANADNLAVGAMGFYNEAGDLLGFDVAADPDYVDCKEFIIAHNRAGNVELTKAYTRKGIDNVTYKDYVAPVNAVVAIGGTTAQTRLTIEDTDIGEVGVTVYDRSFSQQYPTNQVFASVYKKASMTVEQTVDALVAKLGASTQLPLTVAKLGSAGNFGISMTSQKRGQVLSVALTGLIEGNQILDNGTSPSVLPVNGSGVGEDIYQYEFEASMYNGNSYSRELTTDYFSASLAVVKTANYDQMIFKENLNAPYVGETNVKPFVLIAIPNGAGTSIKANITAILGKLVGGTELAATQVEPGDQ